MTAPKIRNLDPETRRKVLRPFVNATVHLNHGRAWDDAGTTLTGEIIGLARTTDGNLMLSGVIVIRTDTGLWALSTATINTIERVRPR